MKARAFFTLSWVLVGLISSLILSISIFGLSAGALDTYLLKGSFPWPVWAKVIAFSASAIVFISVNLFFLLFGVKRGKKFEAQSPVRNKKIAKAILGFITLIALSAVLSFTVMIIEQEIKASLNIHEKDISGVSLKEIKYELFKDGFRVSTDVAGKSEGDFLLDLTISSEGYVKSPLIKKAIAVKLFFPQQTFEFSVIFEDLEEIYYLALLDYIPTIERKYLIREMLKVDMSLKLVRAGRSYNIKQEKAALAKVIFVCNTGACKINLSDTSDKTENIPEK
ncbi:MAG: hypothetical protein HQL27_01210 [Candidatus Omnitrophica bacterium]|nr:hypothetical protein [Candidatus Omnitrophota bacterium]